ncbi:MAG TPA: hypothetical protein GX734_06290 [Clostridiaceae bacterium]|jgi:hypothetical protein|nr:hypothetical protein [Clostridiaceae bacterium]
MRKVSSVIHLTVNEFRKWFASKRMLAVALMMLTCVHFYISPICKYCRDVGYRIAPFIFPHLVTRGYVIPTLLFLATILFCNAPFMDNLSTYEIARSGKKQWLVSKLFYVYTASFVYVAVLFGLTLLFVARYLVWIGEWGKVITTLSLTTAGHLYDIAFFSDHILKHCEPLQATLLAFLMLWLQTAFVGVLIFAANLFAKRSRSLGILLAAAYGASPMLYGLWDGAEMITISPAMWSIPYYLKPHVPGVLVSYTSAFWLMALFIALLSLVSWLFFRKRDMEIYPEL